MDTVCGIGCYCDRARGGPDRDRFQAGRTCCAVRELRVRRDSGRRSVPDGRQQVQGLPRLHRELFCRVGCRRCGTGGHLSAVFRWYRSCTDYCAYYWLRCARGRRFTGVLPGTFRTCASCYVRSSPPFFRRWRSNLPADDGR